MTTDIITDFEQRKQNLINCIQQAKSWQEKFNIYITQLNLSVYCYDLKKYLKQTEKRTFARFKYSEMCQYINRTQSTALLIRLIEIQFDDKLSKLK